MELVPSDKAAGLKTPVWDEYRDIVNKAEGKEVRLPRDQIRGITVLY